jgi:hypothetical protein
VNVGFRGFADMRAIVTPQRAASVDPRLEVNMSSIQGRIRLDVVAGFILVLSAVVAAQGTSGTPVVTAPAEKAGWWIRVNPNSQATHVYLRFGRGVSDLSAPISWVRGQSPDAIDVPAAQRTLDGMHVAALGIPPKAPVSFCLFFKDHGVALVEFGQERTLDVTQAQNAPECIP